VFIEAKSNWLFAFLKILLSLRRLSYKKVVKNRAKGQPMVIFLPVFKIPQRRDILTYNVCKNGWRIEEILLIS
jgi:hypothetical protein